MVLSERGFTPKVSVMEIAAESLASGQNHLHWFEAMWSLSVLEARGQTVQLRLQLRCFLGPRF